MNTLLLPGTLCDESLWAGITLPAGAMSCPVVEGHNLTSAARRVYQAVSGPLHLVGFSLGAIVAFEVLRQIPERIERLTLISANPHAPTESQCTVWTEQERLVKAGQFGEVVCQTGRTAGTHQKTVEEMAWRVGKERFKEQLELLRTRPDSRPILSAFKGPCQILVGGKDQTTPPRLSYEMAELMPQAVLRVIEGANHYLPLQAPDSVTAALHEVLHD